MFIGRYGDAIQDATLTKMLKRFAETAGIHATPHMLRHSFVYVNREALTLKELQTALGHSKSTHTLDMYGDMLGATPAEIGDRMDKALEEAGMDAPLMRRHK
jgi:integrase